MERERGEVDSVEVECVCEWGRNVEEFLRKVKCTEGAKVREWSKFSVNFRERICIHNFSVRSSYILPQQSTFVMKSIHDFHETFSTPIFRFGSKANK